MDALPCEIGAEQDPEKNHCAAEENPRLVVAVEPAADLGCAYAYGATEHVEISPHNTAATSRLPGRLSDCERMLVLTSLMPTKKPFANKS